MTMGATTPDAPSETSGNTGDVTAAVDGGQVDVQIVDVHPGQRITVTADFGGVPKHVGFSYLAPGDEVATEDPGFGEKGSKIKCTSPTSFRRAISTKGMRGGDGWWYFYSDDLERARVGKFRVLDAPPALVGSEPIPSWWVRPVVGPLPGWACAGLAGATTAGVAAGLWWWLRKSR